MAISLKAYNDAALTSVATKLTTIQRSDGLTGPVDFTIYFGSVETGKKFQASSNPGVADIVISVADASVSEGQSASAVKLAATSAGLDAATAGAPLVIGPEILSEPANAVEVHVRVEADNLAEGTYNDLSLTTNALVEINA